MSTNYQTEPLNGIPGVVRLALTRNVDERGALTEIFRQSWLDSHPPQWNLVESSARALRGMRVHIRHVDVVVPIYGTTTVGLCDLRRSATLDSRSQMLELFSGGELLVIPPGVAHGFYSPEAAAVLVGVTHYWDPDDELSCRWNDPELGIEWFDPSPVLSPGDVAAPSLRELRDRLQAFDPLTY